MAKEKTLSEKGITKEYLKQLKENCPAIYNKFKEHINRTLKRFENKDFIGYGFAEYIFKEEFGELIEDE